MTMEHYERLPIEIEVAVEAATLPLRQILELKPGSILPCARRADGLAAISAGGQLLGYGRVEQDGGYRVRVVTLSENMQ